MKTGPHVSHARFGSTGRAAAKAAVCPLLSDPQPAFRTLNEPLPGVRDHLDHGREYNPVLPQRVPAAFATQRLLLRWRSIFTDGGSRLMLYRAMSYAIRRSIKNKNIHLIFMEAGFDSLPGDVRDQGPWQHLKSGVFRNLLDEYQKAIEKSGYVIVDRPVSIFSAEV